MTQTENIKYKNSMEELTALIRGRAPIIWVITHEEGRFINELEENVAEKNGRELFVWSGYQGIVPAEEKNSFERASGAFAETWHPMKALSAIMKMKKTPGTKGSIFVMRDMHAVLAEPVPRQMRDMYNKMTADSKSLIIVSPLLAHGPGGSKPGLPPTLEKQITVIDFELPSKEKIQVEIDEVLGKMKEREKSGKNNFSKVEYSEEDRDDLVRALQGLTYGEVVTSISTCLTHLKKLSVEKIINDKRQIIKKSAILEFIDSVVEMDDIGGLDVAKEYLKKYGLAYSDEAKDFGVDPLKGILLTGVPGTGKSQLAKAVGKIWKVPLLRLDVGKVMTGLVGGSEQKMREVINQAEAMAPCVTGETLITTKTHGDISAKDLHKLLTTTDEQVLVETLDPKTLSKITTEVNTVIRRDASEKELLKISLENGKSITVTNNHKLLVRKIDSDFTWIEAKDLQEDDDLVELD